MMIDMMMDRHTARIDEALLLFVAAPVRATGPLNVHPLDHLDD
jgi:hypothetical protein